jgi:hypothetical protein
MHFPSLVELTFHGSDSGTTVPILNQVPSFFNLEPVNTARAEEKNKNFLSFVYVLNRISLLLLVAGAPCIATIKIVSYTRYENYYYYYHRIQKIMTMV